MKKILPLIIFVFAVLHAGAQQFALSTQYMFNDFIMNPAIAGVKDYMPVTLSVRRQWMGINEAPVTQSISAHGYVGMNLGCGGYIVNEVTGPTRRTSANFSIAYHLRLSKSQSKWSKSGGKVLSFGLSGSLSQHKYDINKLTTYEQQDPAILNTLNYQVIPDANAGVYLHSGNRYFLGFSVFNLIQARQDLFQQIGPFNNGFKRQYYLSGGYNIIMSKDFSFQPSFLFEMIEATPFQVDAIAKFIYQKQYWLAVGYRLNDAITAGLGIQKGIFRFGYSYDYTLSEIRAFSTGSHELNLTIFLSQDQSGDGSRKRGVFKRKTGAFNPVITDF